MTVGTHQSIRGDGKSVKADETIPKGVVLAAEENGWLRRMIRVNLEADGLRVCEAETREECLEIAQEEDCDLILLSLDMPGLDPVQTVHQIRKREGKELPALLVSAEEPSACLLRALAPVAYLRKPFDAGEMAGCVRRLLGRTGGVGGEA